MKPFTHSEMLDLFEAINCLEDIQTIGEVINDYPELFRADKISHYENDLICFINLWI